MSRQPPLARRFFDRFEPVHAVTYFAPESRSAFDGLGFRGFWASYFPARSAPFGVGRDLKQRIEDTTDRLALSELDGLDDDEVERLFRALTPITRKVVAAGDVPAATPMGLGRDDLHDDSAHLV